MFAGAIFINDEARGFFVEEICLDLDVIDKGGCRDV